MMKFLIFQLIFIAKNRSSFSFCINSATSSVTEILRKTYIFKQICIPVTRDLKLRYQILVAFIQPLSVSNCLCIL